MQWARGVVTGAVVAIAAVVAGCGGQPPSLADTAPAGATATAVLTTTAPSGPAVALGRAFATLRARPYASTLVGTQRVDGDGLPALPPARLSASTRSEIPERVAITRQAQGRRSEIVTYDGALYLRGPTGRWAEVSGAVGPAVAQGASPPSQPWDVVTRITEAGRTEVNGRPAREYHALLDGPACDALAAGLLAGLGEQGIALADLVAVDGGTASIAVDEARGAVSRVALTLRISLDLGPLAPAADPDVAAPVVITSTSTETVTAYGAGVTVTEPRASTTISTRAALGKLLAGR